MAGQQALVAYLANGFKSPALQVHVDGPLPCGLMRLAALVCNVPTLMPASPCVYDDAFLVGWQIADPDRQRSSDSPCASGGFFGEETWFHDIWRDPTVFWRGPYHLLLFYLPRSAINHFDLKNEERGAGELCRRLGIAVRDPVIDELGRAILSTLVGGAPVNILFVDHVLRALCAHVAQTYGGAGPAPPQPTGLATWQERRAKELMSDAVDPNISLRRLADECGLSVSHFVRAFRKSTGLPPHQWQLRLRIERATTLMMKSEMPLSQVALDCGFADQSHFTRVFARAIGATPSAWRKANRSQSNGNFAARQLQAASPGPSQDDRSAIYSVAKDLHAARST